MDGRNDAGQMDRWTEGFMMEFTVQWTGGRTLDGQVDGGWTDGWEEERMLDRRTGRGWLNGYTDEKLQIEEQIMQNQL